MRTKAIPPGLKRTPIIPDRKNVAYIVCTDGEEAAKELRAKIHNLAEELHLGSVALIEEVVPTRKAWKPTKINAIVESLRPGDRLLVPGLSSLGRKPSEILQLLGVAQQKGIEVHAGRSRWKLDASIPPAFMGMAQELVSALEADLAGPWGKAGLRDKRSTGRKRGRPRGPGKSKLDAHQAEIFGLLENGSTKTFIAKKFGCSIGNLRKWLSKHASK
jgi:DNA invertase Pin-like site-specific DNA recombinase